MCKRKLKKPFRFVCPVSTELFQNLEYTGIHTGQASLQRGVGRMKQEAQQKTARRPEHTIILSAQLTRQLAQGCMRLLLGAVLSLSVVLGEKAPFGAALVAASGPGIPGAGAVIGAVAGSLCLRDTTVGLRYASAALLVYAAAFAFYDLKPLRKAWTMPLAAACAMAFTGLVAHSRYPWHTAEQVDFVLEIALTAAAVWCFRAGLRAFDPLSHRESLPDDQRRGVAVLAAAVLAALERVAWSDVSLGRCLGGVLTLWAAALGGAPVGAAWGCVLGAGLDLAGKGGVLRCVVFPLGAMAAGCLTKKRAAPLCFLLISICAIWVQGGDGGLACAVEVILSTLIFLLIPRRWRSFGQHFLPREGARTTDPGAAGAAKERLTRAAQAYHTLCESLKQSLCPPENDGDISLVFDRAASRACRGCANRSLCWQRDYSGTFNALNDATAAMVERGRALAEDFPLYFASRCIKLPDFLTAVNEELTALFYRRQYKARIHSSRESVCAQYDQLSELLYETAQQLGQELTALPEHRKTLRRWMAERGFHGQAAAFRDGRGLLRLHLGAEKLSEEDISSLSDVLKCPLRLERAGDGELTLVEQEPFKALAGVASRKKDGETVSGDALTYFKRSDGRAYLLLCDGMGSGEAANRESALAIRLLEQFIQTGIPADHALLTLTCALALRGEDTGGFTTVDLLEIDLFTGESTLYKLGAAPTYVRQGDTIRRLAGTSLPAGLSDGSKESVDRFALRLCPGDWVLMVSDGVCPGTQDGWLLEALGNFSDDSPRKLAARLVTDSPQGATDDRTAMAVRFERRS